MIGESPQDKGEALPFAEGEQVVVELEELDAIRAYDEAKNGSQDSIAFEQAVREIEEGYEA